MPRRAFVFVDDVLPARAATSMSDETHKESRLHIGDVLFLDLVGYSNYLSTSLRR